MPLLAVMAGEGGYRPGVAQVLVRAGHTGNALSIEEQSAMLLDAGFREVTTAWQYGDNHVLVGIC